MLLENPEKQCKTNAKKQITPEKKSAQQMQNN